MPAASLAQEEAARLVELQSFAALQTPPTHSFQIIVERVAAECEVPFAAIALVNAERQWFRASVGVFERETARSVAFCASAVGGIEPLVVPDTTKDDRFSDNPLVVGPPFLRFYAGVPLVSSRGLAIGALCAIDTKPRDLTRLQVRRMRWLAGRTMILLNVDKPAEQGPFGQSWAPPV